MILASESRIDPFILWQPVQPPTQQCTQTKQYASSEGNYDPEERIIAKCFAQSRGTQKK